MAEKVDLEKEEKQVKEQTEKLKSFATNGLYGITAVAAALLFYWIFKIAICPANDIESCNAKAFGMAPNEWGDFFAGLGSSLALVFISWGLFLQMMELRLQRLEMRANRQEQEEATAALEASNKYQNLYSYFTILYDQLNAQPHLVLNLSGHRNNMTVINGQNQPNDAIILNLGNLNSNHATIMDIEITPSPNQELLGKIVPPAALSSETPQGEKFTFCYNLNTIPVYTEFTGSFVVKYRDKLNYNRTLGIEFQDGKLLKYIGDKNIVAAKDKRTNLLKELGELNETVMAKET